MNANKFNLSPFLNNSFPSVKWPTNLTDIDT